MYSSEHLAKNCEKLNFLPRTEGHDFVLVFVKSSSLQNTDPSYSKTECSELYITVSTIETPGEVF